MTLANGPAPVAAVDISVPHAQHKIEVVIGAEGMAPRQPVEDHQILRRVVEKRPGLRLGCWLEVSMRWVLITAFGVPVEPR